MASDHASANHAPHANLDVDYVISYRFSDSSEYTQVLANCEGVLLIRLHRSIRGGSEV